MNKQHLGIGLILIGVIISLALFTADRAKAPGADELPPAPEMEEAVGETLPETGRIANPEEGMEPAPEGKLKADTFTGTLESVDTGCFADGECSIEVDGKHVTALMGWSRDTVGSIQGVPGFGDLEMYIGKKVEVYAQEVGEGANTLYGSEGFYIKVPADTVPNPSTPPEGQTSAGGCVVGGCSSQLCVEGPAGDVVSTCEWREEYACYGSATCERQSDGACGWTMTESLETCLSNAGAASI